ncbi:MAG: pimeloyl-ACP methyl ester carboxylesterase [Hyphomicrobiaceae bacterium]|jgi:pimeloyl-ACP methyl ester carboxylesterase
MTFRRLLAVAALLYAVGLPFHNDQEHFVLDEAARAGHSGRYLPLHHGVTHYDVTGPENGDLVVFVHGFSSPAFVWGRIPHLLGKAGYRTVRYDLYGRGLSDRPDLTYDFDLYQSQLIDLLNALRVGRPFHLVGLSMGGAIAVDYAASFPDRVASLTLIDPAGFPMDTPVAASLMRAPWLGEYLMKLLGDNALLGAISHSVADQSLVPELTKKFRNQLRWKGTKRALLSTLRHTELEGMAERFRVVGGHRIPTLLFWGTEDQVIPLRNSVLVQSAIPHARLVRVEGAGHLPHYEQPGLVATSMKHFFHEYAVPKPRPARSSKRPRKGD